MADSTRDPVPENQGVSPAACDSIERYDRIFQGDPEAWTSKLRDEFAYDVLRLFTKEPERLLDYGCGNGHTIEYLQERWPGVQYYGVDISVEALELARKRCPDALFSTEIPAQSKPFAVILLLGVAEHFKNFDGEMRRLSKHLAPSGLIYLEMPNNLAMTGRKVGGWYENNGQMEWHLPRWNWEEQIEEAGLYIEEAFFGPRPACEFVWVLRSK